jgi:hypothetical protein
MSMEWDTSEVDVGLAGELGKIAGDAVKPLREVVQTSARRIRDGMRSDARGHAHSPYFPSSITYETKFALGGVESEIGPDKGLPQGALGNILYFGTSKNGPVLNINGPLDTEAPRFQKAVEDAAGKFLDG